jgi:hypothetical protein
MEEQHVMDACERISPKVILCGRFIMFGRVQVDRAAKDELFRSLLSLLGHRGSGRKLLIYAIA